MASGVIRVGKERRLPTLRLLRAARYAKNAENYRCQPCPIGGTVFESQ
jgi:hypothetical protein